MTNVCAVRSLWQHFNALPDRTIVTAVDIAHALTDGATTHEAKSAHRFVLGDAPINGGYGITNFIGNYAECKHCGAIYWEENR